MQVVYPGTSAASFETVLLILTLVSLLLGAAMLLWLGFTGGRAAHRSVAQMMPRPTQLRCRALDLDRLHSAERLRICDVTRAPPPPCHSFQRLRG